MPDRGVRARGAGLLAALLLLSLAAPGAAAEPWVLLLGLGRPGARTEAGPPSPSRYRTLVVAISPAGVASTERTPLILARKDLLWEVGVRRRESKAWVEDEPFAAPLGAPGVRSATPPEPKNTSGYSAVEITFAGGAWLSTFRTTAGYTEGAAHPWERRALEVASLDAPSTPVGIAKVLGVDALVALRSRGERYLAEHPEERDRLERLPRRDSWGIVRRRGDWVVRGLLGSSSEVFRGCHAVFDVGVDPPARLVGPDSLPGGWSDVFRYVPRALDAFSSPDGQVIAVMTPGSLHLYAGVAGLRQRKPMAMLDLHADETAVSLQWATGVTAERWRKELR